MYELDWDEVTDKLSWVDSPSAWLYDAVTGGLDVYLDAVDETEIYLYLHRAVDEADVDPELTWDQAGEIRDAAHAIRAELAACRPEPLAA